MMPASTKKRPARKPPASEPPSRSAKNAPWKLGRANGLLILRSPNLSQLDWLLHGFSTRPGGASEMQAAANGRKAAEKVLNLGFTDWDSREHVLANREKFFRAIGASRALPVTLLQIHSDLACGVSAKNPSVSAKNPPKADALFTRDPGILLVVQIADCVPILLADTKRRAIAAIHSGWRGTVQRIAQKTLGRMQMEFGTRPGDVIAAIGPCIGQSCYEVGGDVAKEFHAQFANAREWFDGPFDALASGENDPNWLPWLTMRPPGHPPPPPTVQLDLVAANRAILIEAGVPAANISASGFCTACRKDLFFSYRREGTTGRMMAAIAIR
jgi:purine-nucleoside/S-methyl-5'-thioadenosine phosphorylase / adenosine deaminase